ncbi:tetratricopeptide repeat protein [Thalassotalea nanhaiensis]|uniref:Tetratricopeptide repeat protein n=1 Tax=Thalassotalea nanhaiensis TaxID=3065648 RepID=A0ABY9TIX5_9GAMM|nr:tetratricopeptide repeat protein [Colwelliaceae bacterium SQ345]
MIKIIITNLALMITLLPALVQATNIKELNPIQSLKIESKYFKEPIDYNITLPKSYNEANSKDKKYFVIFDLHPRSQPYLSGLHDWLSHNGEWPWLETIVVTPADYNPEFAKVFEQIVSDPTKQTMLDFFEFDLLTKLDKTYRTNGFRIYSGFMGNGALGLFALLNRPNLFNAYIISSPSLANDFGAISSDANKKLAQLDDKMRFLYLATGNHQYEQGNLPAFELFEKALTTSSPKSLDWQVHRNNQNNYMSQPIVSTLNGIEALFADIHTNLAAESEISQNGAQAIIDYYAMVSEKKYGFDISAEGSLKALAKSLMKKDPKKALSVYQKTIELYPESAYALSSLAKAYAELGDIDKAIKYQTQAVEKSKSMIEWHQNKHKQYLDEFRAQLNDLGE